MKILDKPEMLAAEEALLKHLPKSLKVTLILKHTTLKTLTCDVVTRDIHRCTGTCTLLTGTEQSQWR